MQNNKIKTKKTCKINVAKRELCIGCMLITTFTIWTALLQIIDVQPIGQNGTDIGFATINNWFHQLTGVHMTIYTITDWLGLVPVVVCMMFGGIGFFQLLKRRSLFKVDYDIIVLGIYYIVVIVGYLIFEEFPMNYRPTLIEGVMEASYPSSTTLLVLSVMPTLIEQTNRRVKKLVIKNTVTIFTSIFSLFMVIGRLISGVHWITDIIGGILLSAGLFYIYRAAVLWEK